MTNGFFDKLKAYFSGAWREILAIIVIAVVDLLTKNIVQSTMTLSQRITVIPGLLYFCYIHNKKAAYGSAFGLEKIFGEEGVITFFIVLTIVALVLFGFMLWKFRWRHLLSRLAIGFIIGGAFGNLVDRIVLRYVRDFIQIEIAGFSPFGIFNIADVALVFGVIMFFAYFIFYFDKDEKALKKATNATESSGDKEDSTAADAESQEKEDSTAADKESQVKEGEQSQADAHGVNEENKDTSIGGVLLTDDAKKDENEDSSSV